MQKDNETGLNGFLLRAAVFFCGLGGLAWQAGEHFKRRLVTDPYNGVFDWVLPFFNPYDVALINYALLCLVMCAAGMAAYIFLARPERPETALPGGARTLLSAACAGLLLLFAGNSMWREAFFTGWLLVSIFPSVLPSIAASKWIFPASTAALLLVLCLEPARVATGRVLLMNEYPDLREETLVAGSYRPNKDFLRDFSSATPADAAEFKNANLYEYTHQNMSRGQMNHIGHILNPLNEYEAGKPAREVFMQYGYGNTMLFRWTMELFGGLSLHNYYKVYWFYVLYYLLFLAAVYRLFRDHVYSFFAFCGLAGAAFSYCYVGFILAPGIIPTIHFADVLVLLLLPGFFARPGYGRGLALAALACAGVFLNRQFGAVLALSLGAAAAMFSVEKYGFRKGAPAAAAALLLPLAAVMLSLRLPGGGTGELGQYLAGFMSFRPSWKIVALTVLYLAASYLFLFLMKRGRGAGKYLYVFLFLYAQGLLFYFYWSGMLNHLPMAAPFLCLQLLLMLFLAEKGEVMLPESLRSGLPYAKWGAGCVVLLLMLKFLPSFYTSPFGAREFRRTFASHRVYDWDLDRARVTCTADPAPLKASVEMLRRYSGTDNGIWLVSRYDNLLPFLAAKYNRLPFFEMPWYLSTEKKLDGVVSLLRKERPAYVFADTDIAARPADPWEKAFPGAPYDAERASRLGRISCLNSVFAGIAGDYRLKEAGPIISVYERNAR